jgi:hypothetical protein
MRNNRPDDKEVLAALRAACIGQGGLRRFCKQHGFSESFVCTVRSGQEKPTDRLIDVLGWEKIVSWSKRNV